MFPGLIHHHRLLDADVGGGGGGSSAGLVLTADPKPRLRWTADLHDRFVDAVAQLGGPDTAQQTNKNKSCRMKNLAGSIFFPLFLFGWERKAKEGSGGSGWRDGGRGGFKYGACGGGESGICGGAQGRLPPAAAAAASRKDQSFSTTSATATPSRSAATGPAQQEGGERARPWMGERVVFSGKVER
uniref:Uncharacterized protein n=1 Tax=Oryza glumipatula TaxID=40148 RepID=A0A0E0AUD6_9ORYZ